MVVMMRVHLTGPTRYHRAMVMISDSLDKAHEQKIDAEELFSENLPQILEQ
jgi:hypothetical protein